ncbi:MAG TPA: hypothetical protein VEV83_00290 [Parafilimonas sp.]|nr:hypothetical protein [Parafilimonas sp.]
MSTTRDTSDDASGCDLSLRRDDGSNGLDDESNGLNHVPSCGRQETSLIIHPVEISRRVEMTGAMVSIT